LANAFTVAVQSMHNDQSRMDGISRNLANASTAGYQRETAVATPFAQLMQSGVAGGVAMSLGVPELHSAIDQRAGSLKLTGSPLDVAIEGDGYFEVATASGPAYTRQGHFHLDTRGRLVTDAGDPVMGTGGEIQLTTLGPQIDRQGHITESGRAVGQLKAVRFNAATPLVRLGAGLMQPTASAKATPSDAEATFRQGHVETSNVTSMTEMVELVETMRHFESGQRVVQAYDEMLDKAFRKLGDL
jgi:flagellar basal-body rod protein FlgG